ncbi:MAG: hypothetical protein AAGC88_12880 [Bacteroidota bacterium]
MLAALMYWKDKRMNPLADKGLSDSNLRAVTKAVNGGLIGFNTRKTYTENAATSLNKGS